MPAGQSHVGTERHDADAISKLTKEDMVAFFSTYIAATAPKRSKLAVHMRSQKLTSDAALHIISTARDQGSPLSEDLQAKLQANPTLAQAKGLVDEHLKANSVPEEAASAIRQSVAKFVTPAKRDGVEYVDKSWRTKLEIGPPAEPVEEFHALD